MNIQPITPANMKKLALNIMTYLHKHEMDTMVHFYVNQKHLTFNKPDLNGYIAKTLKDGTIYYESINPVDVEKQLEYCNPETLSITFEGPMYHDINYGKELSLNYINKQAAKYGLYAEQGYAWSLSLYQ